MKYLALFVLTIIIYIHTFAQVYKTTNGYAEFQAEATFNDYEDKSNDLTGTIDLENKTVRFLIPVKSIDTGIGKRNRDMHKLLEVNKYPNVEFIGKIMSAINSNAPGLQPVTVFGTFKLHGVERNMEVNGTIELSNQQLKAEAQWEINITSYNIKPPRFLLNKVKDKHVIIIKAILLKN